MYNIFKILPIVISFITLSEVVNAKVFPRKPITIIVPYSAGGSTDNFVRALAGPLKKALGTNVIVRNIAGGGGAVGTMITLAHPADGYTVTITSNALYTLQGLGTIKFKTSDFEHIARIATEPYVLAVRNNNRWNNLANFIQYAQKESVAIGYAGVGSSTHIMAEAISQELGFNAKLIPYDGGAAAVAATLGGHIDGVVLTPAGIASGVDSGMLSAIGITGASKQLPNVPFFTELGFAIDTLQWRGIAAPAGLPANVKEIWITAVSQAVQDENFQQTADNLGIDVNPAYRDSLDAFVDKGSKKLISLTKSALTK